MFTGIVRERGRVVSLAGGEGGLHIEIEAPETAALTAIGDSVDVDGCCLTATAVQNGRFSVTAVPESSGPSGASTRIAFDVIVTGWLKRSLISVGALSTRDCVAGVELSSVTCADAVPGTTSASVQQTSSARFTAHRARNVRRSARRRDPRTAGRRARRR